MRYASNKAFWVRKWWKPIDIQSIWHMIFNIKTLRKIGVPRVCSKELPSWPVSTGGWAISQVIPSKYACQLGFKQNNRRTWWSINEENKTTNIVTVPWNRLQDQTARITHITNEYAQTSDGWVDQQCRRANGALSNRNDHKQCDAIWTSS